VKIRQFSPFEQIVFKTILELNRRDCKVGILELNRKERKGEFLELNRKERKGGFLWNFGVPF